VGRHQLSEGTALTGFALQSLMAVKNDIFIDGTAAFALVFVNGHFSPFVSLRD
jgi:hypothetical protein